MSAVPTRRGNVYEARRWTMPADHAVRDEMRRLRVEERRSFDFIAARLDIPAHHAREIGRAMGLPMGRLNLKHGDAR